jgi:hypothetical protein
VIEVEGPEEVAGTAEGPTCTYTEIWSPFSLPYSAQRAIIEGCEAHLRKGIFPSCSKKSMHRKVLSPVKKKTRLLLLERAAQKSADSRAQWWLEKEPGWSNDLGSSTQAIWKGYPRQSERVYLGLRTRSLNTEAALARKYEDRDLYL